MISHSIATGFKHMITGADNSTVDISRVLLLVSAVFFIGYSGWEVYKLNKFEHVNFALGITTILAGGAAGVRIKSMTEPSATVTTKE